VYKKDLLEALQKEQPPIVDTLPEAIRTKGIKGLGVYEYKCDLRAGLQDF
jgi:hypothetical protein